MPLPFILDLRPGFGLGPIEFGMRRGAVRDLMVKLGFPFEIARGEIDFYCDAAIQVEFGSDETVLWIGVSFHRQLVVRYLGTNVFDVSAQELFYEVAKQETSGKHEFNSLEYFFPEQAITLWEADSQYDQIRNWERVVWAQVGLGDERLKSRAKIVR